jgi:phospholipase/carboxylesterase
MSSPPQLILPHLARAPLVEVVDDTGETTPATNAPRPPRPPLLVLLHGYEGNETTLFRFAPRLEPRFQIVCPRGPLELGSERCAWFTFQRTPAGNRIAADQLASSVERMRAFIAEAIEAYQADAGRVYLLGFSQGAILALTLALTTPRLLAGVVALAGRIPAEITPWLAAPEETAGLPVLLAHGRDDTTLPVTNAHAARARLEEQRVALTYREYDAGHRLSSAMLADVNAWLAAQLAAKAFSRDIFENPN